MQEFTEVLKNNDFVEPVPFYWHKTNHHTPTPVSSYTRSVEQMIIAFKPNMASNPFDMNRDPRLRHNFIECPSVTKYVLDAQGCAVNKCQKPADLSRKLALNHCAPGDWALNIGPGAGGCLQGLVQAGVNVVAIESDEKQFRALQGTVWQWKEDNTYLAPQYVDFNGNEVTMDSNTSQQQISQDAKSNMSQTDEQIVSPELPIRQLGTDQKDETDVDIGGDQNKLQCAHCDQEILVGTPKVTCESGNCGDREYMHPECTAVQDQVRKCLACMEIEGEIPETQEITAV